METKEERKRRAQDCCKSLVKAGRTCSGCDDQFWCGMGEHNAKWLFGTFLPAIDPTGLVFGVRKG